MGFRRLVDFNKALLAKQVWRMIKFPESLAASIFKAKYFRDSDIMEAKIPTNASYIWRSLMWSREILKKGIRWKINSGKNVRVFSDAWLNSFGNGRALQRENFDTELKVSYFIDGNGQWDREKMENILYPVETEAALQLEIHNVNVDDHRYWCYDEKGMYSVKSGYLASTGYFAAGEEYSGNGDKEWWKYIWRLKVPPKVRIFAWRLFNDFVPVDMNLRNHHVPVRGICCWCKKDWGTSSHCLLFCEKVKEKWKTFGCWNLLRKWRHLSIHEIGEKMRCSISCMDFERWVIGLWSIWSFLCASKHNDTGMGMENLYEESDNLLKNYRAARVEYGDQIKILPKEGDKVWHPPRRSGFRMDIDYAHNTYAGKGGLGAVVRNASGGLVVAMARPCCLAPSILAGELKAMAEGIGFCIENNIAPLEVFTDSILAVHATEEGHVDDLVFSDDLPYIISCVRKDCVLSIKHARREANRVAHALANVGSSLVNAVVWHEDGPEWLSNLVSSDLSS